MKKIEITLSFEEEKLEAIEQIGRASCRERV